MRGIIGVSAALSAASAAVALADCAACRTGPPLAWWGSAYYAVTALLAILDRTPSLVRFLGQTAFAVHLWLVVSMIRDGPFCVPCLLVAAGSAGLAWLCIRHAPGSRLRRAFDFFSVLLFAGAAVHALLPPRPALPAPVRTEILVFRRPDCPYCEEMERSVLPRIREACPRIRLLDAAEFPFVRFTPTTVVRGPGGRRVLEGLLTEQQLREALAAVAGGSDPEGR